MTPRERAYQLRDALRAREIALDATAVNAVEAAILADRAERDAVRESADVAYERALAEQAAGEAERVREAVAREREACADLAFELAGDGGSLATWRAIRARATSPEPEPVAAERAVVEAAEAWRRGLLASSAYEDNALAAAVDALAAARKGG